MIQKAIDEHKNRQVTAEEYLGLVRDIRSEFINNAQRRSDVPGRIRENAEACAFFRAIKADIGELPDMDDEILCDTALAAQRAIEKERKVDFWQDERAVAKTRGRLDDFYYDVLRDKHSIKLDDEQMDGVTELVLQIAKNRDMRQ